MPVFNESVGVSAVAVVGEWLWTDRAAADVDAELAEASAFAVSTMSFPACCLAAAAGCGATLVCTGAAGVAVADGSDVPELVAEVPDAAVFACAATGALSSGVFGVTGAVVATAAVNAASVAPVCVAACFTGAGAVPPPA